MSTFVALTQLDGRLLLGSELRQPPGAVPRGGPGFPFSGDL